MILKEVFGLEVTSHVVNYSSCSICASKYLSDMIPWLVCFLLVAY